MKTPFALTARLTVFVLAFLSTVSTSAFAQSMPSAKKMMDWGRGSLILFDQLEIAPSQQGKPILFDMVGWYGGAYNRVWLRTEGEAATSRNEGSGYAELLAGRLISPYWDALVGVRLDRSWESGKAARRALLSVGLEGLAPLRFELAPTLSVTKDGDVLARLDASYQFLFTQRVVLEPSLDLDAASAAAPEFGVGTGINNLELGARLRYEVRREFAPYIGVLWARRFGSTAALARVAGNPASEASIVFGARIWR